MAMSRPLFMNEQIHSLFGSQNNIILKFRNEVLRTISCSALLRLIDSDEKNCYLYKVYALFFFYSGRIKEA